MKTKSKPKRRQTKTVRAARATSYSPNALRSFRVIAMAASEGGLKALSVILSGLPADFPAAIAIVMHLSPHHESILAEILDGRSPLEVKQAKDGDFLRPSCVFVAPPNHHLLVGKSGSLKLSSPSAKKVNYARPSAEPLFVSVAKVYQQNAIAVVLTGGDGDGSFGVQIIKDEGGMVIAQDQPTSANFSMPETSIETGDVDFILPLDKIGPKLIELVERGVHLASPSVRSRPSQRAKPAGGRRLKRPEGLGPTHKLSPSLRSPSPQPSPAGRGSQSARTRTARTRASRRRPDAILPLTDKEGSGEGKGSRLSKMPAKTRTQGLAPARAIQSPRPATLYSRNQTCQTNAHRLSA